MVLEQIHPFVWIKSEPKYLALFKPGTHFVISDPSDEASASVPAFFLGESQELGQRYFKGLSIAFFEAYLRDRDEFLPYLSSAYAQSISQENAMSLDMIQSLTPEELATAYGKKPPIPVVPEPVEETIVVDRDETVLAQIRRTGVLKLAMRRDAAPFGYIDSQKQWTGYCSDLAVALQNHLADKLDLDLGIELAEIPSTLENRYSLIQDDTVELECGPNTIRQDIEGITFSNPIGVSGTRFLSQKKNQDQINPNLTLEGLQVGVLKDTTTEYFIETNYPQAKLVYFEGLAGRADAIKAVTEGSIDTFASDGILTFAEVKRQNLPVSNYSIQPKAPLTCDFYGLILPNNDPEWQTIINGFLLETSAQEVRDKWFSSIFAEELNDLEYCFNR